MPLLRCVFPSATDQLSRERKKERRRERERERERIKKKLVGSIEVVSIQENKRVL